MRFLINEVGLSREAAGAINRRIHRGKNVLLEMTDRQIKEDVNNILPNEIVPYRVTPEDLHKLFDVLDREQQALQVEQDKAMKFESHIQYVSGVDDLLRQVNKGADHGRIRTVALTLNLNLYLFTSISFTNLNNKLDTLRLCDDDKALILKAWWSLRDKEIPQRERTYNHFNVKSHSSNAYFV